ncbi:MAG: cache domain-containing protein [Bacteroidales bacterium]|nr:cache domain-containing protein [Bacteroidales bacterium]
MFFIIIPAFERNALEQKRLMLHELTNTAWSILEKHHNDESKGLVSAEAARQNAMEEIKVLRYGSGKKDYFWITDLTPRMVMHPYVHELTGKSLHDYADPDGKKIFILAAEIARKSGEGYIIYKWQFMDDSTRIVPKLSFIKKFEPWGWIIGTGVYLNDVQQEISLLTRKLIFVLLGITGILSLIISFIAFQSLKIEGRRQDAERRLHESKEKYKSLLGSSTEGIVLLLNTRISYSNLFIQNLLDYSGKELSELSVNELFAGGMVPDFGASTGESRFETKLIRKDRTTTDVVLTILPVQFSDKQGLLFTFRDISEHRSVITRLEDLKTLIGLISDHSGIGLFRFALSGKSRLMEFNSNLVSILGYSDETRFKEIPLIRILANRSDLKGLFKELKENRIVTARKILLKRKDGSEIETRLSLFLSGNNGESLYCDGIVEPLVAEAVATGEISRFSNVLASVVSRNNLPVRDFMGQVLTCPGDASLATVVEVMQQNNAGCVLLMLNRQCIGIITRHDIVDRLAGLTPLSDLPAAGFMTAPVVSVTESTGISDAVALMVYSRISHLVISSETGEPSGVLEKNSLFGVYSDPAGLLGKTVELFAGKGDFIRIRELIPFVIKPMLDESWNAVLLNRIISDFNDEITTRIVQQSIATLGKPPVPFVFFSTGSEGRHESVFNSDQDNAIIYLDEPLVPAEELHSYFLSLGKEICARLDASGLPLCKGNFMASNPRWCQPLSVWKEYFSDWIVNSEPASILNISAFFDLRMTYGDQALFNKLEDHIFNELKGRSAFFYMLAQSIIAFRPPLNVFRSIVTETSGKNAEVIDIKNCLSPVIMFARIFSLYHNIRHKGTVERMNALSSLKLMDAQTCEEVIFHYNFLMQQRLRHQVYQVAGRGVADNWVEPKKMSEIGQMILKKVFLQINSYDDHLSVSFMGGQKGM